jgi:histidine triad (HIT) family protein
MDDCIFCKIVAGEISSHKIYEDDVTYAFLDNTPVNPGHTLVIPKVHSRNVHDIQERDWRAVMETTRMLCWNIKESVGADGINIMMNNERPAGQVVFHSHVHIIPRLDDDGLRHWPGTPYDTGAAAAIAQKITHSL